MSPVSGYTHHSTHILLLQNISLEVYFRNHQDPNCTLITLMCSKGNAVVTINKLLHVGLANSAVAVTHQLANRSHTQRLLNELSLKVKV